MAEIKTNPEKELWNDFITSQSDAKLYHSYEWKRVLEKTFGYKPLYLSKIENDKITAAMPLFEVRSKLTGNRLVSCPFSTIAGTLGENNSETSFLDYIKRNLNLDDYSYLLIKSLKQLKIEEFEFTLREDSADFNLFLDKSIEEIWKAFPVRIRTAIRKAEKTGVTLHKGKSREDIDNFYTLMLLTRKKFGVPPFSKNFYINILEEFEHSYLYFAVYDEKCISSLLSIEWNGCCYYFMVASDSRYLKINGNDFLAWEMIKEAYRKNIKHVNFGRTELTAKNLISFKRKWGAVDSPLYYYYIPKAGSIYNVNSFKSRLVHKLFAISPITVTRKIGPILIEHIG